MSPTPDPAAPRTELLAPAGDLDAMRAAVAGGADAVYFGLPDFNARRRATNFTREQLPETIDFLHRHNVRGYVTLNTLVFDDELPRVAECLAGIARAGADAVIVQDLGLARLAARLVPTLSVHASTQMTLTEPEAIELARTLGVCRVILARELSLDDLRRIRSVTDMPLEVFVHGALCISYSGQCHASGVLAARSANRGLCAQPCRLPWQLDSRGRAVPGAPPYPLCPTDLAALDRVGDLVDLGIASLKIEGRLKDARYVAAAVAAYRDALDAAIQGRPLLPDPERRAALEQSFSRGLTTGFLDGTDHRRLVHGQSPKSRGRRVGTVHEVTATGLVVELGGPGAEGLKPGDGLLVTDGADGETGGRIAGLRQRGNDRTIEIRFMPGALDPDRARPGAEVWKNDDPQVERQLRKTFSRVETVHRTGLQVELSGLVGGALVVRAVDADGRAAHAEWPGPLEAARRHPLTVDLAREQFDRLGGTPLRLDALALRGPDGPADRLPVMAPKSVLNELRREVVELLMAQRTAAAVQQVADPDALDRLLDDVRQRRPASPPEAASRVAVLVRTEGQFEAILDRCAVSPDTAPHCVYVDFRDDDATTRALERCRAAGLMAGPAMPRIMKPGEGGALAELLETARPPIVLVRNLGSLAICRRVLPESIIVADASLNVVNALSARAVLDLGAARITPAMELDADRTAALAGAVGPAALEAVAYAHAPLFHTEHCLYAARLSRGRSRTNCGRPCRGATLHLRGRAGAALPVVVDGGCRNTVFAAAPRSDPAVWSRLRAAGVRHTRIELLNETAAEVVALLERFLSPQV